MTTLTAPVSILEQLSAASAQDSALVEANGRVLSRDGVAHTIRALARGFTAAGLTPGERVLFAVRPNVNAVLLMIAICEAGGVVVPLDVGMGPKLFAARITALAPRWIVAESLLYAAAGNRLIQRFLRWRGVNLPALNALVNARLVRVGPALPGVPKALTPTDLARLGRDAGAAERASLRDDDPTMIVFTSGTSGAPKAVVHTRRSMQGIFDTVGALLQTRSADVIYARELHLILPALFAGATAVVPPRRAFTPRRFARELRRHRVTNFFGTGAELQQLAVFLQARRERLPATLREIWIGAAPVHAAMLRTLQAVLPATTQVWCVYGMTEILPVARVTLDEKMRYRGSGDLLGRCVPGVHARLASDGELLLRGPNLFAGYLDEPPGAELATGDLARLDEGRIVLLGRRKDMIIRRRFNIYPELYEATIEAIDGVDRCALIGYYDSAVADERVVLVVEASRGVEPRALETRLWRELRAGPRRIDTDALPDAIRFMTLPIAGRSAKVDKQSLRAQLAREAPCVSR